MNTNTARKLEFDGGETPAANQRLEFDGGETPAANQRLEFDGGETPAVNQHPSAAAKKSTPFGDRYPALTLEHAASALSDQIAARILDARANAWTSPHEKNLITQGIQGAQEALAIRLAMLRAKISGLRAFISTAIGNTLSTAPGLHPQSSKSATPPIVL